MHIYFTNVICSRCGGAGIISTNQYWRSYAIQDPNRPVTLRHTNSRVCQEVIFKRLLEEKKQRDAKEAQAANA